MVRHHDNDIMHVYLDIRIYYLNDGRDILHYIIRNRENIIIVYLYNTYVYVYANFIRNHAIGCGSMYADWLRLGDLIKYLLKNYNL